MCTLKTTWKNPEMQFKNLKNVLLSLKEMEKDELIEMNDYDLKVLEKGRPFVRNICMAFDKKLHQKKKSLHIV